MSKNTMHKSFVQHPEVLKANQSEMERIALRFIELFDKTLEANGISTKVGIEQEMYIQPGENTTFDHLREAEGVVSNFPTIACSASDRFAQAVNQFFYDARNTLVEKANAGREARWEQAKAQASAAGRPTPQKKPKQIKPSKSHPYLDRFEYTGRGNPGRFEMVTRAVSPARAVQFTKQFMRSMYDRSTQEVYRKNQIHAHNLREYRKRLKQEIEAQKSNILYGHTAIADALKGRLKKAYSGHVSTKGRPYIVNKGNIKPPHYHKMKFPPAYSKGWASPSQKGDATIYSQHINISQHIGGKNLALLKGYQEALKEVLCTFTDQNMLMIAASPHSYARFRRGGMDDHHLDYMEEDAVYAHVEDDKTSRVEYRVPDASSHPYLSTLLVVAASYYTTQLLARLGDQEADFSDRVLQGAELYEQYTRLKLSDAENRRIGAQFLGTPLTRERANYSDHIREAYQGMVSAFRSRNIVQNMIDDAILQMPTHEQTDAKNDAETLMNLCEHIAANNLQSPSKKSVGEERHYCDIPKNTFDRE